MNRSIAVVGLGFGDEGKGATCDWLCATRRVGAVVRFNGGPQAGHNVLMADGREHTFSQFGSGTFRGVPTFLSHRVAVRPDTLRREAQHLEESGVSDPLGLLAIDAGCPVVTPYHAARQALGDPNGSCGSGFGEAVQDAHDGLVVLAGETRAREIRDVLEAQRARAAARGCHDLPAPDEFEYDLAWLQDQVTVTKDAQGLLLRRQLEGPLVFEGAQGALLDQDNGFHPYTTWSDCTFAGADELARAAHLTAPFRLGVLRAGHTTRHGAGPLVSEHAGAPVPAHEANAWNPHQGAFRLGWFDAVAHEYAARVTHPDAIALTHLDTGAGEHRYVDRYFLGQRVWTRLPWWPSEPGQCEWMTHALFKAEPLLHGEPDLSWSEIVQRAVGYPVEVTSMGPYAEDRLVEVDSHLGSWVCAPAALRP